MSLLNLFRLDNETKLYRAGLKLEDLAYDKDKWGFADTPSEAVRRKERIKKQIRKVHSLGGNPQDHLSYSYRSMIEEALNERV